MHGNVKIGLMTPGFILWRCLHGGPLTPDTIMKWETDPPLPWMEFYHRNMPLLTKITETYGACAVIARHGEECVGQLRFYPKIVQKMCMSDELAFCLQQKYPHGPADDFIEREFPSFETLEDKTLIIHCIMTGSPKQEENPYQRVGLGSRMVQFLIEWARAYGWKAIEAKTHEDIPLLYAISGCAGKTFWMKLGFEISKVATEESFLGDTAFTKALRDSALEGGTAPELVANTYTMRLELRPPA